MKKFFGVMLLSVAMMGLASGTALAAKQANGDCLRDQQKLQSQDCGNTCQYSTDCDGTQDRDRDQDGSLLGFLKWMFGLK